jgi:signal transduction histidine kinase
MNSHNNSPGDEILELRAHQTMLRQELEETHRGMVALYAELNDRADSLKRAAALKTEFLSHMTHEFRTPLNSIMSISQMLIDRLDGDLTDEQEKQIAFIQKAAKDLTTLVNDMLDMIKVDAGKMIVRATAFKVSEMFGTLRGMLRPLLEAHSPVALIFEEPKNIPDLETDEGKVSQILRNFISNGLKFTKKGEVRVKAAADNEGNVTFSVADTGIGIAPADQERIFEEFIQVEGAQGKTMQGTGLGLPLAKRLAALLGGYVSLKSEIGQGSTFSLTIPVRYAEVTNVAPFAISRFQPDVAGSNILVIDDSEADRYVLRRFLKRPGVNLMEAESGMRGIELARQIKPDFIILDLTLPDISGFDVLENLSEAKETQAIPVIIHSSLVLRDHERDFLASRTRYIVSKDPAHAPEFKNLIETLLSGDGRIKTAKT